MSESVDDAAQDGMEVFRKAASDPHKVAAILQDPTCVGAFVLGLDQHDELVKEILEVLLEMLKRASATCKTNVRDSIGMLPQLEKLRSRPSSTIQELAQLLYDQLTLPNDQTEELEKTLAIAGNPAMASALIKDDHFMLMIVTLLSNTDNKTVQLAIEILSRLSDIYDNRLKIRDMDGVQDALQSLFNHLNADVAELSQNLYEKLTQPEPLRDRSNQNGREKSKRRRSSFFLGSVAKSKMVVLQVRGMNDRYDAEAARNSLLMVKGVISITCDMKQRRIILRTKPDLKVELIGEAILRTMTMMAEQVVKDDDGNEVLVPFNLHTSHLGEKDGDDLPDYPDEPSPVKGDQNVARVGEVTPAKDKAYSFVKSVGSFLSNSFYW